MVEDGFDAVFFIFIGENVFEKVKSSSKQFRIAKSGPSDSRNVWKLN